MQKSLQRPRRATFERRPIDRARNLAHSDVSRRATHGATHRSRHARSDPSIAQSDVPETSRTATFHDSNRTSSRVKHRPARYETRVENTIGRKDRPQRGSDEFWQKSLQRPRRATFERSETAIAARTERRKARARRRLNAHRSLAATAAATATHHPPRPRPRGF